MLRFLLRLWMVVLVAAVGACGDEDRRSDAAPGLVTHSGTGTFGGGAYQGPCLKRPKPGPAVQWLPDDLPMPAGTYPITEFPLGDFRAAVMAAPVPYTEFVRFVAREWQSRGWIMGQGEEEPGESESQFLRGENYGAFRAREVYCEDGWSEIFLSLGRAPGASGLATTTTTQPNR